MFKKNKQEDLTLQKLLSNVSMRRSLEALPWQYAEDGKGSAWEVIRFNQIEDESIVFSMILAVIKKKLTFGDYVYNFYSSRIERHSDKIKPKTKFFQKFKLSKAYKIRIKKKETTGRVIKVE